MPGAARRLDNARGSRVLPPNIVWETRATKGPLTAIAWSCWSGRDRHPEPGHPDVWPMSDTALQRLAATIRARRTETASKSYTRELLDAGPGALRQEARRGGNRDRDRRVDARMTAH